MSHSAPRVSVLIPNYNNGKASSRNGQTDLIGDLLQSLYDTLHDDPTPVEIIVHDDGSTDDSLETLRAWSAKTWRDGQPFLKLIEAEHTGILSIGANRLVRASRGEFLARLDGDTQMLTRHWATLLCQTFDQAPQRLGMVGPKQLRPDGKIHAYGDRLLHPKGYHHIDNGADRYSVTQAMQVEHVMGCFYCCKRKVYDEVGGYDETILRGQTIDFGLTARLKGWLCWAVPHIEYVHRHGLRGARKTEADTQEGVMKTLDTFRRKWGFDRLSPDLDVVRQKYAGTPLVGHPEVFGIPPQQPSKPDAKAPALPIEQSEWPRYSQDAGFKQMIDLRIGVVMQIVKQAGQPKKVAVVDCDAGLTAHLLAAQGLACVGTDIDPAKIALANQCIANQTYSGERPTFLHQTDSRRLPMDDGAAQLTLLFERIERHDNPVALLREAHRITKENGVMVIVTKRPQHVKNQREAHRYYRPEELIAQLNAVGGWNVLNDLRQGDPNFPMILLAQRLPNPPVQAAKDTPKPSTPCKTNAA